MATKVNGEFWDYSDVELSIVPKDDKPREIIAAIPAISYGNDFKRVHVWGTGKEPLDTTTGKLEPREGSMTFYAQRYRELITLMGDGYMQVKLIVLVKMRNGEDGKLFKDNLEGKIQGEGNDFAVGDEPLQTEVPIMWTKVRIAGMRPVK